MLLTDSHSRQMQSLRISVTDRCNLRCFYCIPREDIEWLPRNHLLDFDEIERLARLFVQAGIRKIRLTGGEPLLRRDLPHLVERLGKIPDLEDLALTTNATQLVALAEPLAKAGLKRVNISLDSLRAETFFQMTRRDLHQQVLDGIAAAEAAGLLPIRLNVVLVRDINEAEILDFARFARERAYQVRFIEFMPLEHGERWGKDVLVPGHEVREKIDAVFPLLPESDPDPHSPSRNWVFRDGAPGQIGFIDSVTQPFCSACNRIRLTADGKLRTCLFSLQEHDLLARMRSGASDEELLDFTQRVVLTKEKKHAISDGIYVKPKRTMSAIGG